MSRTVINQLGTVVERNDYYPYGMQMAHNQLTNSASGSDNKRKFGGKELDVMSGLNTYDFEARPYDLNYINLWTADPKSEKKPWISPYVYCSDNPVNRVDPDGRNDYYKTKYGQLQAEVKTNTEDRVVVSEPLQEVVVTGKAPKDFAQKIGDGVAQVADGAKTWVTDNKETILKVGEVAQKAGDVVTNVGLGIAAVGAVTGVGTGVGLTIAGVGSGISTGGELVQAATDLVAGDMKGGTGQLIEVTVGTVAGKAIGKVLPGSGSEIQKEVREAVKVANQIIQNKTEDKAKEVTKTIIN